VLHEQISHFQALIVCSFPGGQGSMLREGSAIVKMLINSCKQLKAPKQTTGKWPGVVKNGSVFCGHLFCKAHLRPVSTTVCKKRAAVTWSQTLKYVPKVS